MRQAHRIDVGSFHQLQVLLHQFFCHHTGTVGVVFMTVDATYLDCLTVDEQLSVLDVDGAESHLLRHLLHHRTISLLQLQAEGIEIGMFHTPQLGMGNPHLHAVELAVAAL